MNQLKTIAGYNEFLNLISELEKNLLKTKKISIQLTFSILFPIFCFTNWNFFLLFCCIAFILILNYYAKRKFFKNLKIYTESFIDCCKKINSLENFALVLLKYPQHFESKKKESLQSKFSSFFTDFEKLISGKSMQINDENTSIPMAEKYKSFKLLKTNYLENIMQKFEVFFKTELTLFYFINSNNCITDQNLIDSVIRNCENLINSENNNIENDKSTDFEIFNSDKSQILEKIIQIKDDFTNSSNSINNLLNNSLKMNLILKNEDVIEVLDNLAINVKANLLRIKTLRETINTQNESNIIPQDKNELLYNKSTNEENFHIIEYEDFRSSKNQNEKKKNYDVNFNFFEMINIEKQSKILQEDVINELDELFRNNQKEITLEELLE